MNKFIVRVAKSFRHQGIFWTAIIVLSRCSIAGADTAAIQKARDQIMVNLIPQAKATLEAELKSAPQGEEKDIARILYVSITTNGNGRTAPGTMDFGPVTSDSPAIHAEQERGKISQELRTGKRAQALADMRQFLKDFPDQFTDHDVFVAVQDQVNSRQNKRTVKTWLDVAQQKFPNSPLLPWIMAMGLHWQEDAPQGVELMRKAEAGLSEPLLSAAREHELTFQMGNTDNPNQAEDCAKIGMELFTAGQIDPHKTVMALAPIFRSPEHPEGMADWICDRAAASSDPQFVAALRDLAVDEYITVGKQEAAKARVAQWRKQATDAGQKQQLDDFDSRIADSVWELKGTVPGELMKMASNWQVFAVMPSVHSTKGQIAISSVAVLDEAGRFRVQGNGIKIASLVAAGTRVGGLPFIHELGSDITRDSNPTFKFAPEPATEPAATESSGDPLDFPLVEYFGLNYPAQLIQLSVPHDGPVEIPKLRVTDGSGVSLPCQYLGQDKQGRALIGVWRGLKAMESTHLHVAFDGAAAAAPLPAPVKVIPEAGESQIIDVGAARFRIPAGTRGGFDAAAAPKCAFIQAVSGPDGVWRGHAQWSGQAPPTRISVRPVLMGPIRWSFACDYSFANGATRNVTLSFDSGEPVMLIDEQAPDDKDVTKIPGDFIFHLDPNDKLDMYAELLRSARGKEPLVRREPQLGMNLKDYPYFSVYQNAMLGAFWSKSDAVKDCISTFVVHPGDWYDPSYTEAFIPLDEHPDDPWDHPYRYTGSTHAAIECLVNKDNDAPIRIPMSPGTRRWGISVTDHASLLEAERNELWDLQNQLYSYNNGDLSRYVTMTFHWPLSGKSPLRQRIHQSLMDLSKMRDQGFIAADWAKIDQQFRHTDWLPQMLKGLRDNQPLPIYLGWQKARDELHTLARGAAGLESDHSNSIDPVSARGVSASLVTYLVADEFGLIDAGTRVQIQEEAARIAYHLYSADFMNYHMNSGQPNFEADRLLQLASFCAVFPDHPLAGEIRQHVLKQTDEMLRQWTIRDGGKWAENVGNYYLHSMDCLSRCCLYLSFCGPIDGITSSSYFEAFCRFSRNMIQPPMPPTGDWLKHDAIDPGPQSSWLRRMPGVGAHAGEGGNFIGCPMAMLAQAIADQKPELAAELLSDWQACGCNFVAGSGHYAGEFLLFGKPSYGDIKAISPDPKRLPGWGMVMRDDVGTDHEFYLAFHAGTVAYRDDGFGSAIILHALGRPLSLDGGDNGEPKYHSVMLAENKSGNYGPVPLGKVTRWLISDAVQFARGEFRAKPNSTEVFMRDVLFARDQYVVIHDETSQGANVAFNFVTPAASCEQKPEGVFCRGKLGVDLWLIPLTATPPQKAQFDSLEYGNERTTEGNMWKQFAICWPLGASETVLLHPVKAGDPPATTHPLAKDVWQISGTGFNDVLFTGTGQTFVQGVGAVSFNGSLGLLRTSGHSWNMSILDGTAATVAGKDLSAKDATTFYSDGSRATGNDQVAGIRK